MAFLDDTFVKKQGIGVEKYKQIMESKFVAALNDSLQYKEL